MERRYIFIEVGAWIGNSLKRFIENIGSPEEWEIVCFEPLPFVRDILQKRINKNGWGGYNITILPTVATDHNGNIELYISAAIGEGSTYKKNKLSGIIDYDRPILCGAIDFSQWLKKQYNVNDYIAMIMNIEGAEYDVLKKMMADDTLKLVDQLQIHWHKHKIKDGRYDEYEQIEQSFWQYIRLHGIDCVEGDGEFFNPERETNANSNIQ